MAWISIRKPASKCSQALLRFSLSKEGWTMGREMESIEAIFTEMQEPGFSINGLWPPLHRVPVRRRQPTATISIEFILIRVILFFVVGHLLLQQSVALKIQG